MALPGACGNQRVGRAGRARDVRVNLDHDGLGDDDAHKVGVTPTITAIAITTDPGDDDTYKHNEGITFKVAFNIPVTASGAVVHKLEFKIGGTTKLQSEFRATKSPTQRTKSG